MMIDGIFTILGHYWLILVDTVDGCEIRDRLIAGVSYYCCWVSTIQGGAGFLPSTTVGVHTWWLTPVSKCLITPVTSRESRGSVHL